MSKEIKGYIQLSRAWYGETNLKMADCSDEVSFGFYNRDGSTTGEMLVQWRTINGRNTPELIVNDSWKTLAKCHDVIDVMAKYDNENITPKQFCECLKKCGFADLTEVKRKNKGIENQKGQS